MNPPSSSSEDYIINRDLPRCRSSRTISKSVLVPNLPTLRDISQGHRARLLQKKLRLCTYVFSSKGDVDSQEARDRELKRSTILELISYLTVLKPSFSEDQLQEIFEMIRANLFRPLNPTHLDLFDPNCIGDDEHAANNDGLWTHLQGIYEFLLRLASSTETDAKLLDKFFNHDFILGLLELFDSEDPRERDYLKTILHRIYGNFMSLRPFIRRAINNVFFRLIYETDRHNGVAELLEILGSIINGFALPLKEQHKQFLVKVLLPLHKVTGIVSFHPQLSYCVTQFLEKDPNLAPKIIRSVIQFWPDVNSKKELMFLSELEEILDRVQPKNLGDSQNILFTKLSQCIASPHFQISERALYILDKSVIVRFININRSALLPLLADSLLSNTHLLGSEPYELELDNGTVVMISPGSSLRSHGHWSTNIVELTADVLKIFAELDQGVMRACKDRFDSVVSLEAGFKKKKKHAWKMVAHKAAPIYARYAGIIEQRKQARKTELTDPPHSIRK